MNSLDLASQIRHTLEETDSRSKLIASVIASALASDEPLIIGIDNSLAMHGYDFRQGAKLGVEAAMRITALEDALGSAEATAAFSRLLDNDQLAMSLSKLLAEAMMIETSKGFAFNAEQISEIRHLLSCGLNVSDRLG